ncbi:MAG: hypothetical protein B6U86_04400 [Candidatus Altiarchaeales archaeon ex4484_43]|nr:MAG: hypothetical protein B6U86_04400 [Candidatus Altiarchaeales archaeon ex4484_43]
MVIKVIIYLLFLFPILILCLLIVAAPYLSSTGDIFTSNLIYLAFSITCHQLPERSFFLFDHKLAVCSRCTGIYFGALITTAIYPLFLKIDNKKTPGKWLLILAIIPIASDGGIQLITSYESTNPIRFMTGAIFGCVLPVYLLPVYNEMVYGFLEVY